MTNRDVWLILQDKNPLAQAIAWAFYFFFLIFFKRCAAGLTIHLMVRENLPSVGYLRCEVMLLKTSATNKSICAAK